MVLPTPLAGARVVLRYSGKLPQGNARTGLAFSEHEWLAPMLQSSEYDWSYGPYFICGQRFVGRYLPISPHHPNITLSWRSASSSVSRAAGVRILLNLPQLRHLGLPHVTGMLRALISRGGQAFNSRQNIQCCKRVAPTAISAVQSEHTSFVLLGLLKETQAVCAISFISARSHYTLHSRAVSGGHSEAVCAAQEALHTLLAENVCVRLKGRHMASGHKIKVEGPVCDLDGDEQTR